MWGWISSLLKGLGEILKAIWTTTIPKRKVKVIDEKPDLDFGPDESDVMRDLGMWDPSAPGSNGNDIRNHSPRKSSPNT